MLDHLHEFLQQNYLLASQTKFLITFFLSYIYHIVRRVIVIILNNILNALFSFCLQKANLIALVDSIISNSFNRMKEI